MLPGVVGIGVAQINFFVDTVFATQRFLPEGSLISLQAADRVMELVLGGYAIAVGTAILPMMSRHAVEKDTTRSSGRSRSHCASSLSLPFRPWLD